MFILMLDSTCIIYVLFIDVVKTPDDVPEAFNDHLNDLHFQNWQNKSLND